MNWFIKFNMFDLSVENEKLVDCVNNLFSSLGEISSAHFLFFFHYFLLLKIGWMSEVFEKHETVLPKIQINFQRLESVTSSKDNSDSDESAYACTVDSYGDSESTILLSSDENDE